MEEKVKIMKKFGVNFILWEVVFYLVLFLLFMEMLICLLGAQDYF